jgi:hypothetical protein
MAFDHVRSRVWWVDNIRIYMADIRNKQVQTYDVRSDGYTEALSVNVEFSSGNAFVGVKDIHDDSFLVQVNRDCNVFLGMAYIPG